MNSTLGSVVPLAMFSYISFDVEIREIIWLKVLLTQWRRQTDVVNTEQCFDAFFRERESQ